ncbi:MAG: hypothetical protein OXH38_11870 [Chloroflexi bacterium]|nr:hypothetical protein [Chloroflexota bacterium]
MPRDGSGRYVRTDGVRTGPRIWRDAEGARIRINALDTDAHANDMAEAISESLSRDGQTSASGDQPMAGHRHLQVAGALRVDQYATLGQVYSLTPVWVPSPGVGGTGDAIQLTVPGDRSGYREGYAYLFPARAGNTGPITIAEGSHGALSALREDGLPFAGGEIVANQLIAALYDGTRFLTNIGRRFWSGTQAQLDGIATKRAGVVYLVLPSR